MHATEVRSAAEMGRAANAHPTAAKMRRASCTHTTANVCAAAANRMGSSAASTTTKTTTTTTASSRRGVSSAREQGHHGNNGEALDVQHGTLGEPRRFRCEQLDRIRNNPGSMRKFQRSAASRTRGRSVSLDGTTINAV
jgi:hypothetical protein